MLEHIGVYERSLWEWQRFDAIHFRRPWQLTTEPVGRTIEFIGSRKAVYEVGFGVYCQDANGEVWIDLTFGPLYGRGYRLSTRGELSCEWVS